MPQITLKETIFKKIEIPMDALYDLVDNYNGPQFSNQWLSYFSCDIF